MHLTICGVVMVMVRLLDIHYLCIIDVEQVSL